MVDVGSAPLVGAGEALAPGNPHAEQMVAAAAAGVAALALP
jgi:pyrimidine deaminase RibD-like protein